MANEKRLDLVDRKTVLEELCRYCIVDIEGNCPEGGCAEFRHISELPTVDAVEVVHARWHKPTPCSQEFCTNCGLRPKTNFGWLPPYCPNCGAKMDGGNEDG